MIELFGIQLGTPFQGGTLLTAIMIGVGLWIRGMPDRKRAHNEGREIDDADDAQRRREARKEIHDIKGELAKVAAEQTICGKALAASISVNEQLLFLIELMISEMEAIDSDSKIVKRARLMFDRISADLKDPNKSATLVAAEHTVTAAKIAVEEVKQSENGE